jgi:26S proteasome regulatory subunit T3
MAWHVLTRSVTRGTCAQMDGFDTTVNVKVIMATNRADTLDPALLRPGRLDRKIEFPLPDRRQKRLVFSTVTSKVRTTNDHNPR